MVKWYGNIPIFTEPIPLDYDYSKLKKNVSVPSYPIIPVVAEQYFSGENSKKPPISSTNHFRIGSVKISVNTTTRRDCFRLTNISSSP